MKTLFRSAITGQIVTKEYAEANPDTTVKETINPTIQEIKEIVFGELTSEQKIETLKTIL